MALSLSTLRKPLNRQVVDPSTGVMREEWELYFNQLTTQLNAATGDATASVYGYFDVRDFGAVGDGTTNDASAFQAANDAAEASSTIKRVYVPHSSAGYALGATVAVSEGVTFFGDNRKGLEVSRIKPASGFTDPLFESDDYGVTRKLRIGLEGLFIDGSSTTLTAVAMNVQESHFRDLTIKNCFTYGIHIGGVGSGGSQQALNNHIEDCYLAGQIGSVEFFDGIFLDYYTADTTIRDCYVEASKDAGIRSRGYNNKIINNHIYSVAGTGGGLGVGIYAETSADQDISHNYIELCAASGVLIDGGGSDVATLNAVVSGNTFRNIDTGNTSSGVVVIQGSDVSSVTIADNTVRRDAATSYATAYFAYFNSITPALAKVSGNIWQSGLITSGESNLFRPPVEFLNASRVLARKTSGAGMGEEATLSELLDFIGSAAQGDILYRGASAWERLPASSDGSILTQASGLPSWAASSLTLVSTTTVSGTPSEVDIALPSGTYSSFLLIIDNLQVTTDQVSVELRFSDDAGATFEAGASDYGWVQQGTVATTSLPVSDDADDSILLTRVAGSGVGNAAGEYFSSKLRMSNFGGAGPKVGHFESFYRDSASRTVLIVGAGDFRGNTNDIDYLRVFPSSGNFDGGVFYLYAFT